MVHTNSLLRRTIFKTNYILFCYNIILLNFFDIILYYSKITIKNKIYWCQK